MHMARPSCKVLAHFDMDEVSEKRVRPGPNCLGPLRLSPPTFHSRERERERERGIASADRLLREKEGRAAEEAKASSMAAVVRSVWQGIREKGLTNFLRYARDEGYLKCLGDGNLLQTKIHNIGATLVGVDTFGNKYYEKLHDTQYGRHRWVEYADKGRYNASQVPAEWHGWLHHITDSTGDKLLEEKTKKFIREHRQNYTGQGDDLIYHSKGHALNPGQRDWTRYQPWEPKKEEAT